MKRKKKKEKKEDKKEQEKKEKILVHNDNEALEIKKNKEKKIFHIK